MNNLDSIHSSITVVAVSTKKCIIIAGCITDIVKRLTFLCYHYTVDPAVGTTVAITVRVNITLRDDLFSTCAKFSENLIFLIYVNLYFYLC